MSTDKRESSTMTQEKSKTARFTEGGEPEFERDSISVCAMTWLNIVRNGDQIAILVERKGVDQIQTITWKQFGLFAAGVINFLRSQGVVKGSRVALLGEPSAEWMIIDHAVQSMGAVLVPLYPKDDAARIGYVKNHSQPVIVISSDAAMHDRLIKPNSNVDSPWPSFLFADVFHQLPDMRSANGLNDLRFIGETLSTFDELLRSFTNGELPFEFDDVVAIIYTSGSSSDPKGVKVTHRNMVASCRMMSRLFHLDSTDIVLHFMTGAHVLAYVNGLQMSKCRRTMSAFCSPDAASLKRAFLLYRPTVMLSVPLGYDRIYKGILKKMGPVLGNLVRWAIRYKAGQSKSALNDWLKSWNSELAERIIAKTDALKTRLADAIIARLKRRAGEIKRRGGLDRLRLCFTGSAASSAETLLFFEVIGLRLCEGYGQSDTMGGIFVSTPACYRRGSLGKAASGVLWKLVETEEETYLNLDGSITGRLFVKGDFVTAGYLHSTKSIVDDDGYMDTGDVVRRDVDGFFFFVGRASSYKKLKSGEFYPEDQIIRDLKLCPVIEWAVPSGEKKDFVAVLLFLDFDEAARVAKEMPSKKTPFEFYSGNRKVLIAIQNAVDAANATLQSSQKIRGWRIVEGQPVVTPTGKLQVNRTLAAFTPQIDRLESEVRAEYARTKKHAA
jgi:long-chain acyl-CoA synthetase